MSLLASLVTKTFAYSYTNNEDLCSLTTLYNYAHKDM
jgi:hypothetical protein